MVVYLTQQNNETLFINYKKIKNMKTLTKVKFENLTINF